MEQYLDPKKISFETNGGSSVGSQTIYKGQKVDYPKEPAKSGYTFDGWYRDNNTFAIKWDFNAVPGGNMTLYAKWDAIYVGPSLIGTATIIGSSYNIGDTLTADTSLVTGSPSGVYNYQWMAGSVNISGANSNTYTIQGIDAGKLIFCVITSGDASGNVTAIGQQEVCYTLIIDGTGLILSDVVFFDMIHNTTETHEVSGSVEIHYALENTTFNSDILTLSFVNTPSVMRYVPAADGIYEYVINPLDAINGVITITASSIHTNLLLLDAPTSPIFNQSGLIAFTEGGNNVTAGSTFKYTLYKDDVEVVGFTNQPITNPETPVGIYEKMLKSAGTYNVRITAYTTNPDYIPASPASNPSGDVNVHSVSVTITNGNGIDTVQVGAMGAPKTTNFTNNFFRGEVVSLIATPGANRYVTWSGDGIGTGNVRTVTVAGIPTGFAVTATFANPVITIDTQPVSITVTAGAISESLSVAASSTPSRTISYHWYRSNTNSNTDGSGVSGISSSGSFGIPKTLTAGTYYYYCVVSAAGADSKTSDVAVVTVTNVFTTIEAIQTYLGEQPSSSPDHPIPLEVAFTDGLGTMTSPTSNWQQLLQAIEDTPMYIALDLSGCSMTGTSFNPDNSIPEPSGKEYIVSLVLPDAATSIPMGQGGTEAFENFSSLKIVSGENVETIGNFAFMGCSNLIEANFPAVTSISMSAFANCIKLEQVSFPKAETIDNFVFQSCHSLEQVSFPKAETIGNYAFQNCLKLEQVSFPKAETIGEGTFYGCESLIKIEAQDFPDAQTIGTSAFANCSSLEEVNFPAVTTIGTSAFMSCSNLEEVNFPLANEIGESAFMSCTNLTKADFPAATTIGNQAFMACSNLTEMDFTSVTSIGNFAFYHCTNLTEVLFPAAATVGDLAFIGCSSLTKVDFPFVINIGNQAFEDTAVNSITLGLTAPILGATIFSNVTRTVNVYIPAGATGYSPASSPFDGTMAAFSGTDITIEYWANALRGMGWNGTTYLTGTVVTGITVEIQTAP